MGKGRLGTGLLFLPKNRSGSGEVVSAGPFPKDIFLPPIFFHAEREIFMITGSAISNLALNTKPENALEEHN
jgi:hypothetical protein